MNKILPIILVVVLSGFTPNNESITIKTLGYKM